jgi:hypothetical protein
MKRRSFLRLLPMAPAAAASAAQQIAAQSAAIASASMQASVGVPIGVAGGSAGPYELAQQAINELIVSGRIPDWKLAQFKTQARARCALVDPDLLSMQSVSMAIKQRMQAERELQRLIEDYRVAIAAESEWSAIYKKFSRGAA